MVILENEININKLQINNKIFFANELDKFLQVSTKK